MTNAVVEMNEANTLMSREVLASLIGDNTFIHELSKNYASNLIVESAVRSDAVPIMVQSLFRAFYVRLFDTNTNRVEFSLAQVTLDSFKSTLLGLAYFGLDLNPERNHVRFEVRPIDGSRRCALVPILGVHGMTSILARAKNVRGIEARCLYESDTFVFLGNYKEPEFSRDMFSDAVLSESKLSGGYFSMHFNDGAVYTVTVRREHILAIADAARDAVTNGWFTQLRDKGEWDSYLASDNGAVFRESPWFNGFKGVMFDHVVKRVAFRDVCNQTNLFAMRVGDDDSIVGVNMEAVEDLGVNNDDMNETLAQFNSSLSSFDGVQATFDTDSFVGI